MKKLFLFSLIFILFTVTGPFPACSKDFTGDTIYFIMIDRFYDGDPSNNPPEEIYSSDKSEWKLYWGGDLQGIIDKLPYIKSLGATAIWITPAVENTYKLHIYGDSKVSSYHGYWGKDFKRINPYFGDMETFHELIEEAHKHDIKIILDFVLNHTGPSGQGDDGVLYNDGEFIADYTNDPDGWFHHNGKIDFTVLSAEEWEDKNLFDLADLNQDNPGVDRYLKESALMWADHGIDGFRLDTVRHIPCRFVKSFADEIYSHKDLFIFGEWSFGNFRNEEEKKFAEEGIIKFDSESGISVIDFNFQEALTFALAKGESFELVPEALKLGDRAKDPCNWVTCVDNHDMPRFISTAIVNGLSEEEAKSRFEMAIYLIMTSRGIPCIYYGSEHFLHNETPADYGIGGDPYNRQMMEDFSTDGEFFKNISALGKLRKDNSAISRGLQRTVFVDEDIYVYEREKDGNVVLVAMNKGEKRELFLSVSLPDGEYSSEAGNRVIGPDIVVEGGKVFFELEKYEAGVWNFNL